MIVNLQRKVRIDTAPFQAFMAALSAGVHETEGHHFSVALVSDRRMAELNKLFRGKDSITDVLSFPNEPEDFDPDQKNLGDIVISVEQAKKQAEENGLSLEVELKQLILHGLLHLCGYDHETDSGEMDAREVDLRDLLGIQG